MASQAFPHTIINAFAPIRICDNGGWTDTWFAEYGSIFNIAVYPYAEVQVAVSDASGVDDRIVINLVAFGRYPLDGNPTLDGQVFSLFLLAVAASEAALGLALVVLLYRFKGTLDAGVWKVLKED